MFGDAVLLGSSFCEKMLVASPTCAKLADMLLTKRTYTYLGGGLSAKSARALVR